MFFINKQHEGFACFSFIHSLFKNNIIHIYKNALIKTIGFNLLPLKVCGFYFLFLISIWFNLLHPLTYRFLDAVFPRCYCVRFLSKAQTHVMKKHGESRNIIGQCQVLWACGTHCADITEPNRRGPNPTPLLKINQATPPFPSLISSRHSPKPAFAYKRWIPRVPKSQSHQVSSSRSVSNSLIRY